MRFARPILIGASLLIGDFAQAAADKPETIVADGVPEIPDEIVARSRPYLEYRSGIFAGWNARTKAALLLTRFGDVQQVFEVATSMGMRRQLSFDPNAIEAASVATGSADVTVVQRDVGGNEFWQIFRLQAGQLTLLSDGKSRNVMNRWSRDGRWLAYTSTRRNGQDNDIYLVDPRDPQSDHMIADVKGGGWSVSDFAPDGKTAIVIDRQSAGKSDLHLMDVESGAMVAIGDRSKQIYYGGARFSRDGTLWVTSDEKSDFLRLGTVDVRSGRFTPVNPDGTGDVESFAVSADGTFVAYILNDKGTSRLKLLDARSHAVRAVPGLPTGVAGQLDIAPWGAIGLTVSSAHIPADMFVVDPQSLAVTRWTASETGGLDPQLNAQPEAIETRSFDGETISGFLYRPDARKFPGQRPLIIDIHGGPESQSRPGFLGRGNYYINELGIAIFYPNVRGSTGYGKRFVSLDNGPFKREDSVRDIGAFLDMLERDKGLDPRRIAVTGGSYGGYMCYASAIRYGVRLRGANCSVAVSNFVTFLETTQSYRRDRRRLEYGDERDPHQRAKLQAISPLTSAEKLAVPLMVVTGGNDPRVPPSEAIQIVEAVRARGGSAWHLLARDEGHGFVKKANQDYAFWAQLMFWQTNLLE